MSLSKNATRIELNITWMGPMHDPHLLDTNLFVGFPHIMQTCERMRCLQVAHCFPLERQLFTILSQWIQVMSDMFNVARMKYNWADGPDCRNVCGNCRYTQQVTMPTWQMQISISIVDHFTEIYLLYYPLY